MIRAKMTLQEITQSAYNPTQRKYIFNCVSDSTTEENKRFCKYTPNGKFEMVVDNPEVIERFKLGKSYYVDFTETN